MQTRPRHSFPVPSPILLLLLLLTPAAHAVFKNDFSSYPEASQECLYAAADASGCDGDTVSAMNSCLCGNGGNFVMRTASCLASSDSSDIETVYDTMDTACSDSGTPLTVSRAKFLSAKPGSTASETTTGPTSTATGTKSGTPTGTATGTDHPGPTHSGNGAGGDGDGEDKDKDKDGGLSSGAMKGIIAGSVIVGLALLSALAFFFIRYRRRNRTAREESHPMLPGKFGGQGGFGGSDVSGDPSEYQKQGDKWQTTQGSSWESPYEHPWGSPAAGQQQVWAHSPLDPATGYPVGPQPPPVLYELPSGGNVTAPVEMGGTPIHPHPPGSGQQYSGADWGSGLVQPQLHPRGA